MGEEKDQLSDDELKQKVDEILSSPIEDKEKIKRLHYELGYSQVQLYRDFDFPRATVYKELPVRPKGRSAAEVEEKEDDSKLPVVLKTGKGQEVITPEGIMQYYLLGDGDSGVAMLKGMMLLRAAQLMVMNDVEIMKGQAEAQATAIKPILDIMEKAREDMDAAAERARQSTEEVAQAAAAGAAARAMMHIDERFDQMARQKKDIAETEKPMQGLMARTMETFINQLTGQMFGGQVGPTPKLVDKRGQGGQK